MIKQDDNYASILDKIRTWPARQRYLLVQDLLKTLEPEAEPVPNEDTLSLARGLLATDKAAPTDEEVAQWLDGHRLGKYVDAYIAGQNFVVKET